MAALTRLSPVRLFRPVGNSQPANLVQYIGREKPAKVLSLGCGDVRNILFTAYCDADNERPLDITCCDIEKAVIARNILLLSVLIDDDATGGNDHLLFKLSFDMVLDEATFQLFRKQGRKLRQRSTSLEKWHNCAYGKVIRFCDSESLRQVHKVWESYSSSESSDISRFDQVKQRSKNVGEPGVSVEMAEAFAPFLVTLSHELRSFHENYWKTGMVQPHAKTEDQKLYWNPTYSFQGDNLIVHPGTCPTEGFNLALGFAPFDELSPLFVAPCNGVGNIDGCVESMKIQYRAWGNAFSRFCRRGNIILRFAVSDALAFCHELVARQPWSLKLDGLYPGPMTLRTMILDSPDFLLPANISLETISNYLAPLVYNAIDASGVTDKCGAMNILLATAVLSHGSLESTVVTEMSVKERKYAPGVVVPDLPGDLMTLAMLIGLSPVEFLSNNTVTPTSNKNFLMTMKKRLGKNSPVLKMRISWRACCSVSDLPIDCQLLFRGQQFLPHQLGKLLYRTYCRMFRKGETASAASQFTPATFAALLHQIKHSEAARWSEIMENMMEHFMTDPYHSSCEKYNKVEADGGPTDVDQDFSEMLVQFQRFGVYDLVKSIPLTGQPRTKDAVPAYVTLVVPRERLDILCKDSLAKLGGSLAAVCYVKQPGQIPKRFSLLRMTFGSLHRSVKQFGRRSWQLVIHEDPLGWGGHSPLFVTFSVPPSLLTCQEDLTVAFGLKKTPQALECFRPSLDSELTLLQTHLEAEEVVYVCNNSPICCTSPHTHDAARMEHELDFIGYHPSTLQHVARQASQLYAPPSGPVAADFPPHVHQSSPPLQAPANVERADSVISWHSDEKPTMTERFVTCTIKPNLSPSSSSLEMFTARLDCHSEDWRAGIRNEANFIAMQMTPCSFIIRVKGSTRQFSFTFPFPVEDRVMLGFVAKESIVIITVAPDMPGSKNYPMMKSSLIAYGQISILGYPYLALDRLPAFDRSKLHEFDPFRNLLKHMQSDRESELEKYVRRTGKLEAKELRAGWKTGLQSLFIYFCGLDMEKKNMFVFKTGRSGEQFYIVISALRLDMANQSFVLDAAVIAVTRENRVRVRQMLCSNDEKTWEGYVMLPAEVLPWKFLLTTGVERARTWSHRPDCEYKTTGHMPASLDNHVNFLCSCGNGKLPANFVQQPPRDWDKVKDMAVRVAISPSYASMLVEKQIPPRLTPKSYGPDDLGKPDYVPECFECGKRDVDVDGDGALKRCGRCNTATYCSRECQVKNHGTHQHACGHYRIARADMG